MEVLKKRSRFLLVPLLLIPWNCAQAQELQKLSEALPDLRQAATINLPAAQIDYLNAMSFGFTTQGVVSISQDRSSLVCYRPDGSIAWSKQPPEKVISAIHLSGDGNIISAYYPISEDDGVTEVMASAGKILWRNIYPGGFQVSPHGKYLYSGPSALSGMPLTVIETETGNILWKQNASDFAARLLGEEVVIHLSNGEIKLHEMKTGKVLAERDIGEHFKDELSHTVWEIVVAEDGNYFTILGSSGVSLRNLIQTYDSNLNLKWSKILEPPIVQLVGLTEDGSKLLLRRRKNTSLYDNFSGTPLWQIEERILNNKAVVTNKFIAMSQAGYRSEVFILTKNGRLAKRFKANSIFLKTKIPNLQTNTGSISLLKQNRATLGAIVEVKKENLQTSAILYTDR